MSSTDSFPLLRIAQVLPIQSNLEGPALRVQPIRSHCWVSRGSAHSPAHAVPHTWGPTNDWPYHCWMPRGTAHGVPSRTSRPLGLNHLVPLLGFAYFHR